MKETLLATYKRESTLWKNANAFYKAQDWTKMECMFVDYSEEREIYKNREFIIHDNNGNDITDKFMEENFHDKYIVRLTNKRESNTKTFEAVTREEANKIFKGIYNHKVINKWKKVQ